MLRPEVISHRRIAQKIQSDGPDTNRGESSVDWRKRLLRAQRAAESDERFPLNSHADWRRVRERGLRDFLREVAFAQDGITADHDEDT